MLTRIIINNNFIFSTRKLKIVDVAHIVFPLDSAGIEHSRQLFLLLMRVGSEDTH